MAEIRIFGPPGCGKTTTLGRLIVDACKEYGSEAVTACSFTKTAARELVGRNLPLAEEQIGTLHAFAFRGLDRPKLVLRSHHKDWNEAYPYWAFGGVQNNIDDPYGDFESAGLLAGDKLLSELNRLRGLMADPAYMSVSMKDFMEAWTDFKDQNFLVDFTDLIQAAISQKLPVPNGGRVLFLDEVQDFSPLELTLARMWGEQCEDVYLAGDDDQCLYAFKGATPMAFLSPKISDDRIRILEQSYRVPREIHAAACRVAAEISTRMPKTYKPRDFDGAVDHLPINYKWTDPLEPLLNEWINAGKSTAILASCSYMLDPVKYKLREWGIPFHNPYRRTRGDWNPLQTRSGSVSAVERLAAFRKVKERGEWWTYHELELWASELEAKGVLSHGAKTAMRHKANDKEWATVPVQDRDLEAWFVDDRAPNAATTGDTKWFQDHLLKSSEKPMAYACEILTTRGSKALRGVPQVILGTIHSVKGGEADNVVLFPDLSQSGAREWIGGTDESRDTILRMFYVGMTRARENLYWANANGAAVEAFT